MEDNWFRLCVVLSLLTASDSKTNEGSSEKASLFVTATGSELLDNSNSFQLTWAQGRATDTTERLR